MHNDALPFTLVVFFVIFFFLMLAPMFYAVVMGVREKNLQMERERLVQLYGFDFERIRQDEPLLMEHIHRLIPMIGIVPTIRYVSSAAGLPIDVAQILVCSEPAAPLTSSPYPMAHPGSAAPQVGTRPSYPMSSRPGTTQFQPDEASASDSAMREASATRTTTPRGQQPNRGTSDEHHRSSRRRRRGPRCLPRRFFLWATAHFFSSRRKPSYATTHRYEELHQLAGAALREAHGDRAQAARIMRHVTRLPRRTIDTALLLHR